MQTSGHAAANGGKRARPCDTCRKRKRRCIFGSGDTACQLCQAASSRCTFDEPAAERLAKKRTAVDSGPVTPVQHHIHAIASAGNTTHAVNGTDSVIEDYDTLPVPSLLKTNLGLQQHRYIQYIGPSDEFETNLLALRPVDGKQETRFPNGTSCRRVSRDTHFALTPYSGTQVRAQELADLDTIEGIVRPYGKSLVNLYFRIIHPCFPILDKKTFLEKYARTYREFSPPCLAGVYMLATKWWHYDRELSSQQKPDVDALQKIARTSLQGVIDRPKLSTIQGGLLLLQFQGSGNGAWALSSQMVAVAQELGLDSNCADWAIPTWEKGLRTRLGWAIFMIDKWMALCRGRPSHIVDDNWTPDSTSEGHLWDTQEHDEEDRTVEGGTEPRIGGMVFEKIISLTHIVSEILQKFYSRKALADISSNVRTVLEQIKPVQVKLREWHRELPPELGLENEINRRLSPAAALHLSYFAAEIALHRVISSSLLRHPCDPQLVRICRDAAKERVTSAVNLVTGLKSQQLQAFWYFPSGYSLTTIGTFTALLFVTSQSTAEAQSYKRTLDDYRWFLRVSSASTEHMKSAVQKLDIALSHVHELTAAEIVGDEIMDSDLQEEGHSPTPSNQSPRRPQKKGSRTAQNAVRPSAYQDLATPFFYEDAILDALNSGLLLSSPVLQQYNFPPALLPRSPAFDATITTPQTLDFDYQRSD